VTGNQFYARRRWMSENLPPTAAAASCGDRAPTEARCRDATLMTQE